MPQPPLDRRSWLAELTAAAPPTAVLLLAPLNLPLLQARLSYLAAETLIENWLAHLASLLPPGAHLCRYDAATAAICLTAAPLPAEQLRRKLLAAPFIPPQPYLRQEAANWDIAAALVTAPPAEPFRLLALAEQQLQAQLNPPLPTACPTDAETLLRLLPPLLQAQAPYLPRQAALTAATICELAPQLGFKPEQTQQLTVAAYLADLPLPRLLGESYFTPGALTGNRIAALQRHPDQAAELAEQLGLSALAVAAIRAHHEQPDGNGYPRGLSQDEIPPAAALLRLAQVYAALRLPRPYQRAFSEAEAQEILREGAGQEWDAALTRLLLHLS